MDSCNSAATRSASTVWRGALALGQRRKTRWQRLARAALKMPQSRAGTRRHRKPRRGGAAAHRRHRSHPGTSPQPQRDSRAAQNRWGPARAATSRSPPRCGAAAAECTPRGSAAAISAPAQRSGSLRRHRLDARGTQAETPRRQGREARPEAANVRAKLAGERASCRSGRRSETAMVEVHVRESRAQMHRSGDPARSSGWRCSCYAQSTAAATCARAPAPDLPGRARARATSRHPLRECARARRTAARVREPGQERRARRQRLLGRVIQVGDDHDERAHGRYRNAIVKFILEAGTGAHLIRGYSEAEIRIGERQRAQQLHRHRRSAADGVGSAELRRVRPRAPGEAARACPGAGDRSARA